MKSSHPHLGPPPSAVGKKETPSPLVGEGEGGGAERPLARGILREDMA
ncbi:MAG: hypothetical protein HYY13_06095 [Nitrospirae bacterium]|nr:hypothetical protein [Nitrospirota bacterium]